MKRRAASVLEPAGLQAAVCVREPLRARRGGTPAPEEDVTTTSGRAVPALRSGGTPLPLSTVLLTAALVFALVATGASAQPAPTPATHILNLAPIAFQASNNDVHYSMELGGLGRLCLLRGAGYFVAIVHLPDGVVVDRITGLVQDANPNSMGMLSLVRRTADKSDVLAMTTVSSDDHPSEELSADAVPNAVVDNEQYTYLLQVVLTGPGVCLRGASVRYH